MAQETRYIVALNVNLNVQWGNEFLAFGEDDDTFAIGTDITNIGDYGGGNYSNSQGTPTSLDLFQVRFFDILADHSDDTFLFQVYNPDTTSWETLETFDTGNKMPTSLTTKTYTTEMQTKFNAASNKSVFLDGLQFRFYMSAKSKGRDKPKIGLAWSKFIYTYNGAPDYYGVLKRWNGTTWIKEPMKTYLAGSWQSKTLKIWDGTSWKEIDTTGS